jgi:SPW repeat
MTSRGMGIESHPDIAALRARYDVAGQMPIAQGLDGLTVLTGLYLAISPWVVGFSSMTNLTINDLVIGAALALLAVGYASAPGRTFGVSWIAPVLGVWTIIAPWVVNGGSATTKTIWSNVVAGAVAVILGLGAISVAARRK